MTLRSLESLPNSSKLWVVGLSSPLSDSQSESLGLSLSTLLSDWIHKGQHYSPAYAILFKQVIVIAEESMAQQASGCAIDGLMKRLEAITTRLSMQKINPTESILWTNDQHNYRVSLKSEIPLLVENKSLQPASLIADFSLETLGQLRSQGLFKSCDTTWIGKRYFDSSVIR